ncbi:MAG: hypothetical protein U0270_29630 [Labilithrix sp.]
MKVDRERFLVMVAAVGAGASLLPTACSTNSAPPSAPTEPVYVPPAPPSASWAPMPTLAAAPPSPPASALPAPPEPPPAHPAKAPNPYDGTPVTAQACDPALNKVGTPGSCALSAPGPTCESFGDTKKECPTLNTLLKPRVAEAANACLRRKSGTKEICEFNVSSICAYEALGSACKEPSAKATCDKVLARCGPAQGNYNKMSRDSCEAGVSGISDAKKAKFVACISESCRFETCLTYL